MQNQTPPASGVVECDVKAQARRCLHLPAITDLRRQPGPSPTSFPSNFFKHADDQTVVGLSAVLHAIEQHGLHDTDFTQWGVLACPRFLGRVVMPSSVQRFRAEGAWGMSPHLVPHRSLHSLSGTISQALKIQGPNCGVGGAHAGADEILITAVALLARRRLPGVWVILTAQEPEDALDDAANLPAHRTTRALALALTLPRPEWRGVRLRLEFDGTPSPEPGWQADFFRLETMLVQLGERRDPGCRIVQPLQGCGRITLEWAPGTRLSFPRSAAEMSR